MENGSLEEGGRFMAIRPKVRAPGSEGQASGPPRATAAAATMSSSERIVRDVVRGLYEGRYVPGQRLVEADLVEHYDVGRGTVREALKQLAAEGIVSVHQFRGARIRQISRKEALDILHILEVIIGLASRLAALNIAAPGNKAMFKAAADDLLAFQKEHESYDLVRARNKFYRVLTRIGGNAELARLLTSMHVHLVRVRHPLPRAARFADYRDMIAAVLEGDPVRAELTGRAHVQHMIDLIPEGDDALPDNADVAELAEPR